MGKKSLSILAIVIWLTAGAMWLFEDQIVLFLVKVDGCLSPAIYHPATIDRQIIIRHAEWRDI